MKEEKNEEANSQDYDAWNSRQESKFIIMTIMTAMIKHICEEDLRRCCSGTMMSWQKGGGCQPKEDEFLYTSYMSMSGKE